MALSTQPDGQNTQLPISFRPLSWSYRFEELEPAKDEKTIIVQLINYGSLTHWRWLVRQYGIEDVREVLQSIPATEIKPRTRGLASLLFSIPAWRHGYRGAH